MSQAQHREIALTPLPELNRQHVGTWVCVYLPQLVKQLYVHISAGGKTEDDPFGIDAKFGELIGEDEWAAAAARGRTRTGTVQGSGRGNVTRVR